MIITLYTLIVSLLLWIPERLLWLLGLVVVAIALPFKRRHPYELTRDGQVLWCLPFFADWCWGNKRDGFGDRNYAVNDCGYASLDEYNNKAWFKHWCWLALRNPVHNLNEICGLYHCNFNKVDHVDFKGTAIVDNRYNKDGTVQTGFQVCWATGNCYLRSGIFWVFKLWGEKVFRFRVGYKIQPRHMSQEVRTCDGKSLYTFSPFNIKTIIPYE